MYVAQITLSICNIYKYIPLLYFSMICLQCNSRCSRPPEYKVSFYCAPVMLVHNKADILCLALSAPKSFFF